MDATSAEDEIENFVQNLQSIADRIGLNDNEEHVTVKLLAFSSGESDYHADRDDQQELEKYKDVFGTWYGFHVEMFIIPKTQSAVELSWFLVRAELEHCENKGRLAQT